MKSDVTILVWDWPIRVFHWLFAITVGFAFGIALLGEHSALFQWHMLFGISAGFLLLMRLALGFCLGSPYSMVAMVRGLRMLPGYVASRMSKRCSSHNPFAWIVYIVMLLLLCLTVLTGVLADRDWAEDSHSLFAWGLLATIVLHIVGIMVHSWRFKENIAMSMFHGRRVPQPGELAGKTKPVLGIFCFGIALAFMVLLFSNYQAGAGRVRVPWIGVEIPLCEGERGYHHNKASYMRDGGSHESREKHDRKGRSNED